MKNLLSNLIVIIIIVFLTIFIQHKYFPTIVNNSTHTSDTIYKDTGSISYIPKPYPVYIDTSRTDTIYIPTEDSLLKVMYKNLHKMYFSTYTYNDTIKNDSLAFINLETTITQNKPIFYKETYFDRTPSVINNTTNIYSENEFYIGLELGVNKLAPSFLFKSEKNYIFGVEYNLIKSDIPGERIEIKGYIDIDKLKLW